MLTAVILPLLGLIVGLIANAASSQGRWPGVLETARLHPWQALIASAVVLVAFGVLGAMLTSPSDDRSIVTPSSRDVGMDTPLFQMAGKGLPRDTDFVARESELRTLSSVATGLGGSSARPAVVAIDGMPGVGKTALAVHASHILAPLFPAGQVFLGLHAFTPGRPPTKPADALAQLLTAIGVPSSAIPGGQDSTTVTELRSAMWRRLTSDRAILLILDDALDHSQVGPLIPGSGNSLVIVTSRRRLAALDALPISLETFTKEQANEFFARLYREPRFDTENASFARLAELCGYLPLAMSLVAGRLRHHPAWTPNDMIKRLTAGQRRLKEIRAENIAVAAAFELSYNALGADQQEFFVKIALHPGTELESGAVSALTGVVESDARTVLDGLFEFNLIIQIADNRYRMHDLVREFARTLAAELPDDSRRGALLGLFAHYRMRVDSASRLVARRVKVPSAEDPDRRTFGTREDALAWMVRERGNVMACVDYEDDNHYFADVISTALAMASFLRQLGPWDEAIQLQRRAIAAARASGDQIGEAGCFAELGVLLRRIGQLEGSKEALESALDTYGGLGIASGRADALNELGVTLRELGDIEGAVSNHIDALATFENLEDILGQARSNNYLAVAMVQQGDIESSLELLAHSLDLFRAGGDHHGEASTLNELGAIRRTREDWETAITNQRAGLTIFRQLGDRHGQANALAELGLTLTEAGDVEGALETLADAMKIFESYGNDLGRARVANRIGLARLRIGDVVSARDAFIVARDVAQRIQSPAELSRAIHGLALISERNAAE